MVRDFLLMVLVRLPMSFGETPLAGMKCISSSKRQLIPSRGGRWIYVAQH